MLNTCCPYGRSFRSFSRFYGNIKKSTPKSNWQKKKKERKSSSRRGVAETRLQKRYSTWINLKWKNSSELCTIYIVQKLFLYIGGVVYLRRLFSQAAYRFFQFGYVICALYHWHWIEISFSSISLAIPSFYQATWIFQKILH